MATLYSPRYAHLTALALLLCFTFLSYLILLAVYRIFFHPLSRYPGPRLAKVTDLYSTYHAWKGDRHLDFWRCHEKYGPIVRFGPNSLSFNSSSALKDIYGFKANVRKADFYLAFPATKDSFSTHSAIDKAAHARKRRVLSHAFSDAAVKSYDRHILSHVRQLCSNLGDGAETISAKLICSDEKPSQWSAPKNLSLQADYLTFDIMGDLCFGKAFGMLERPDNRFAIDLISNASFPSPTRGPGASRISYSQTILASATMSSRYAIARTITTISSEQHTSKKSTAGKRGFLHLPIHPLGPTLNGQNAACAPATLSTVTCGPEPTIQRSGTYSKGSGK